MAGHGSESRDWEVQALTESLLEAVERDDGERVISILDRVGRSALLHHAAEKGHEQLLRFLMDDPGIEVNTQDEMEHTALILASWKGNTESVRLLLQKGADVLIGPRDGITCLHMAAFGGHTEVVNLLLHGKSPRNWFDEWDPSLPALSWRTRYMLMNKKSSLEMFTALHMAANGEVHDQRVAIAASLLEAYRTSVLESHGLQSDPKAAYQIEDETWLDCLLQLRDALNLQDGETFSRAEFVATLTSYGDSGSGSELQDKLGLHKYEGLVRSFAELVSFSNARDSLGRTALHHAAWENRGADLVKFLTWDTRLGGRQDSQLGCVANFNAKDVDGYTPLHFASRNGCTEVAIALLSTDAVALADMDLEFGSRQNRLARKSYLQCNAAARPTDRSRNIATEIHDVQSEPPLLLPRPQLQNFVWAEHRAGITPLHYAVNMEHTAVVQRLLEHPKIDVFQGTSNGQSPWTIVFPSFRRLYGNPTTQMQRLLRSSTTGSRGTNLSEHRLYRQKLLEQAAALAVVAEADSDEPHVDVIDELLLLETQIFVTFVEDLTNGDIYDQTLRSILDENFRAMLTTEENNKDSKNRETVIKWFVSKTSSQTERLTLLHVAAYEGYGRELESLLSVKRYKERINDRENLTSVGHTALHFAILRCRKDTGALAVLLGEKTLRPTRTNRKGQTPLQVVEHLLGAYSSRSSLDMSTYSPNLENRLVFVLVFVFVSVLDVPRAKTALQVAEERLCIYSSRTWLEEMKENLHVFKLQVQMSIHRFMRRSSSADELKEKTMQLRPRTKVNGKGQPARLPAVELQPLFDAQRLLMTHTEVQQFVDHLFRDRSVLSNAANAILVGAALIAGSSYQAWLQPPQVATEVSGVSTSISDGLIFQAFNSLSLSSALAAVLMGAAALLPSHGSFIQNEVDNLRRWFFVASTLLGVSIFCAWAGFLLESLLNLDGHHVRPGMLTTTGTLIGGLVLIVSALNVFFLRLYLSVKTRAASALLVFATVIRLFYPPIFLAPLLFQDYFIGVKITSSIIAVFLVVFSFAWHFIHVPT